ncbi:MAG: PKD domain-containing protein, partial [Halobacteriaceae archaeon]
MTERLRAVVLAAVVVASAVAAGAVPVAADDPPQPPATYYGTATIGGTDLPAGTTITAKIDGETRGSITIEEAGEYGGAGPFERKLEVSCENCSGGETVTFWVGGVKAEQTATFDPGDASQRNLTFPDDQPPSVDASPDAPNVTAGDSVEFGAAVSDDAGVSSVQWAFPDGSTAGGTNASHTFDSAGTYTVTVTATDIAGNTANDTVEVTVESGGGGGGGGGGDQEDEGEDAAGGGGGGGGGPAQTPASFEVSIDETNAPVTAGET